MAETRIASWLLLAGMACAVRAQAAFELSEPKPGVFVHRGRPLPLDAPGHDDIANIGFIVGARCIAVIDSGGSVRVGRDLRAAIAAHSTLPICYVINTHAHVDHVLGNAAFAPDKPSFVGSAVLREAMQRNRDYFVKEYAADLDAPASGAQVIGPDRLVDHELTLDLGARQLQLRAWPKAHTDSDLTVYDEHSGTLWSGDLVFRERLPALDGSLKGWLAVLDELGRMRVSFLVPGHGAAGADLAAAISPERRYLQALSDGVHEALARMQPVEEAIAQVAAAEKPRWLLWDSVHPRNVIRAYEEIQWQ